MVCVPCFIIPILLYVWHKFFQPILLRYWNPWEKKDAQGNVIKAGPEFPFECKGGVCPYQGGAKKQKDGSNEGGKDEDLVDLTRCELREVPSSSITKTKPNLSEDSIQAKKIH